jgi:uroporphyrinogen decarboxylase
MKSRERVLRALEHEEIDIIPYNDSFSSMESAMRFLGERFVEANDLEKTIFLARLFNTDIVNVPTAGFPGGPGIFEEVLYEGEDHIVAKTPFEGFLYWRKKPYFALPLSGPIRCEEDLDRIEKPDIEKFKPKVEILAKQVQKLHELDYFVETEIKGPMESPWMYLRGGYVNFFVDIVRKPLFAKRLIELVFKTMLEFTELVIDEAHVDAVWMTDDLGETKAPFISPEKYRALIEPWHKEAAKRIHKKGAKLCLHSHGNIMLLLEDIVKTGPDSIDPLDPADGMKLAEVKEKYGDRVCIMGGITKNIGRMSKKEIREHVLNVFKCAGPNGFIAMSSGGVPPEMSLENFNYYRHVLEKARRFKLKKG